MAEIDEAHGVSAWNTIGSHTAFANRWLSVQLDEVELPNGGRYEYTRLVPGGTGVGVIGLNEAGEVLLEREYRHGVGDVIWQLPGGLTDDGEDLQSAGLRELLEETGYAPRRVSADTVRYLGAVWDNPALGPGRSHIYAARDLVKVADPRRDLHEHLSLHWVSMDWLRDSIRFGEIQDRVVIAAVLQLTLDGWA